MRRIAVLPLLVAALLLSGCGEDGPPGYLIDLEVWGAFEDTTPYRDMFQAFEKMSEAHIGRVTYRQMEEETYREDLMTAFAEGNGPDVFMIRNAWLPSFKNLIAPAPEILFSEKEFRDNFVDVAVSDMVVDGEVYGVPLSVDSLALYYNKDLLNAAGIATPPRTWEELLQDTRLLNDVDTYGNFLQSAVAMGTAKNVNRSTDVFLTLAMQRGLEAKRSKDGFSDTFQFGDPEMRSVMDFYTQFAKTGSPYYSWNPNQHYSIDAFYEGKLAMMVNYSWHIDTIRRKNAKLDFGVAPLPQFAGGQPANIANYWVLVVAKNKNPEVSGRPATFPVEHYDDIRIRESWQMLRYIGLPHPDGRMVLRNALDPNSAVSVGLDTDPAKTYLEETGQPAARRDILEEQSKDAWLSPFAYGNLIAKSWRVGEIDEAEGALIDAIEAVVYGERTAEQALGAAQNQIRLLQR